jgi:2-polyprenyl-3-methyl-5-hydroxy-6-metoxy-1,4-benzoquinol methylase
MKIVHYIGKGTWCWISEGLLSKKINQNKWTIVGIGLDNKVAVKAKSFLKKVIIGDLESVSLNFGYLNYFEVIISADILKHLKDPLEVLNTLRNYLNDDGHIIISVPKIAMEN